MFTFVVETVISICNDVIYIIETVEKISIHLLVGSTTWIPEMLTLFERRRKFKSETSYGEVIIRILFILFNHSFIAYWSSEGTIHD